MHNVKVPNITTKIFLPLHKTNDYILEVLITITNYICMMRKLLIT